MRHPLDYEDGHGMIVEIALACAIRLSHALQISFKYGAELWICATNDVLHGIGVTGRTCLLRAGVVSCGTNIGLVEEGRGAVRIKGLRRFANFAHAYV